MGEVKRLETSVSVSASEGGREKGRESRTAEDERGARRRREYVSLYVILPRRKLSPIISRTSERKSDERT